MSYTKSLVPHLYRYVPKYFQKKYPKFMNLMIGFMQFLELKNSLSFFDVSTEKDHSIYQNIVNFGKHSQIENLPIKNKDILNSYFKEYAQTLDFRNLILDFDEDTFRDLAKYSGLIFNTKAKWSSYNIFFAIISTYLFNGSERGILFKAYFNEDFSFDLETPPEFYDIINVSSLEISNFSYSTFVKNGTTAYGFVKFIDVDNNKLYVDCYEGNFSNGDDLLSYSGNLLANNVTMSSSSSLSREDIILSEYPLYKLNFGFDGVNVTKQNVLGKGCKPFEYQIISKNDIFISGNFISKFKTAFNPAGFRNEIIYVPEDVEGNIFIDSIVFPKQKISLYTYEDDLNISLPIPGETLYNAVPYNITFSIHNISSVDILIDGVVIENDYPVVEGENIYSYTPSSLNPTMLIEIQDHNSINIEDCVLVNILDGLLTILSLNDNVPLTLVGSYADGTHYFFSINGDIVESSSPFRSGVFAGIGNSDKNIDLDIKTLALELDAFSAPVLLNVNFTASGTATLVSGKVYIEAYNGSVWVDLNNGNPIDVVLGEFELTTAQLKASDGFESGNVYVVRARDFDGYATSSQENIETYDIIYGTTEEGGAVVEDEIGNIFTFSD